ncbi:MAG: hypothetical protein ABWZ25_03975 [Chitinophagaceae bacterium]
MKATNSGKLNHHFMIRYLAFTCCCLLTLTCLAQGENLVKLRYWNGTTDGKGISHPVGLKVSATIVPLANSLEKMNEAMLSGDVPKFYFKKKFALFFVVQNVSSKDVAVYDWAFKAVCPVDNMGRKFDASSLVSLVTPYIPENIYLVLKPGEKKQFYSSETDFTWCLPKDNDDLLLDPKYFQALITCASIAGSATSAKPGQKPGGFQPPSTPPQKPGNDVDPQIGGMIREHNSLIQKNENEKAELIKARILKITNLVYPAQVKLIETKLLKPQVATTAEEPLSATEQETLTFDGRIMDAVGECIESTASLVSNDESTLLMISNLGGSGNFSVNDDFYAKECKDCLLVNLQDLTDSKIYIAVSGSINRTADQITIDVIVKEMSVYIEGVGPGFRVTGKILCE